MGCDNGLVPLLTLAFLAFGLAKLVGFAARRPGLVVRGFKLFK